MKFDIAGAFRSGPSLDSSQVLQQISVNQIYPHPQNPRKDLGDLTELADSIKAAGVLQNLTVVPTQLGYIAVIGHRRLAAAKLAGLSTVPCIVTDMDEKTQIRTMLLENMQRSDLTVFEQAEGFQLMLDLGDSVHEISEKSGFSKTTIYNRLKLLDLDRQKFQEADARGGRMEDYLQLSSIRSQESKNELLDQIGTNNFHAALKKAQDDEKMADRRQEIVEKLLTFAEEIEDISRSEVQYLRDYNFRTDDASDVEVPEDAAMVKYYIKTRSLWVDLFREVTEEEVAAENAAYAEEEARAKDLVLQVKEASSRAFALRKEFVAHYEPKQKHKDIIAAFAAKALLYTSFHALDESLIEELLGGEAETEIEESPTKALLVMAYTAYEQRPNGETYYNTYTANGLRWPEFAANDQLDLIYEFLQKLGYEMADEELELQNGTFPALQDAEEGA